MNSISIDGKKYSKATDIARELGYTADYVGQLCRAKKVEAQLVGRSWYVLEESIRAHKKTRYRNDKKVTHQLIKQSIKAKNSDTVESSSVNISVATEGAQHGYAGKKFYSRADQKVKHHYFEDDKELIPITGTTKKKSGKLSVVHDHLASVKIKSNSKEYDFDPTPREEIRFSGPLSISEVEEVPEEEFVETVHTEDVLTQKITLHTNTQTNKHKKYTPDTAQTIKVRHQRKDLKKKSQHLSTEHNNGVAGMTVDGIRDRNPKGGTLKVAVPTDHAFISRTGTYFMTTSVLMSVIVSMVIVGLKSVIEVSQATMTTSYVFEFQTVLAAVSGAW